MNNEVIKMMKGKFDMKIAVVLLLALAVGWLYMGGTPFAAGATGGTITSQGAQVCPTDLKTTIGVYAVESVLKTSGEEQVVTSGGTAQLYRNGDTQVYDSLTLTGDGTYVWSTTGKELECGRDTFKLIVGGPGNHSGTGYYYTETEEFQAGRAQENIKMVLDKIGTFKINASNATKFHTGYEDPIAQDLTAGATDQDVTLHIKETAGGVIRAPILCSNYYTAIFDEVSVVGGTEVPVPTNVSGFESCYSLGVDKINDYETVDARLKIVVKSTATVAGAFINMSVLDKGAYISDGVLNEGYEDMDDRGIGALDGDGSGSAVYYDLYYI